MVRRKRR